MSPKNAATATPLTPTRNMNEESLVKALEECAREPIHIPGSIQPHGMLFTLTKTGEILQVSANCSHFLGKEPQALIGQQIAEVIGRPQAERLYRMSHYQELQPVRSTVFEIEGAGAKRRFDAVTHFSDNLLILELEPQAVGVPFHEFEFFYDELRDFSVAMRGASTPDELHQLVVENVRNITAFDRVKLYRFDDDWNGEVIAESRVDDIETYLGQHFPHSDIPPQARALYAKNYLRLIADISYEPVPIVGELPGKKPLDLSLSILRSVSPVHVEYLRNMNVCASLSISVIQNDKLWGLIACHHRSPKHLPYRLRMIAELVGHIFSAQLSTLEEIQRIDVSHRRAKLIETLSVQTDHVIEPEDLLEGHDQQALTVMEASGVAVVGGTIRSYGKTPDREAITKLAAWLRETHPGKVFTSHEVDSTIPVGLLAEEDRGILAMPVGRRTEGYLIWFRGDETRTIEWAGKPEKNIVTSEAGFRLTPRGSFETWKETVTGKARPWSEEDIDLSRSIVSLMLENERMAALQASTAKSAFLASMSHELRTPMNAVVGIANILARSNPLSAEQREFISTLQISSHSLLSLINDLLDIAKIEASEMKIERMPFNFCHVIEEVRSVMAVRATEKGLKLNIVHPGREDCHYVGDALRCRQILLNLVSNAVKFTEHGFVNVNMRVLPDIDDAPHRVQIDVSDTGIGMTEKQQAHIFDQYVQADDTITRRFGGTGLGLSIVHHLVGLMNGTISVVSKPGMGTKFTLILPLEKSCHVEEAAATAEPEAEWKQRGKVLLTEDYEGNIMVALTYLQDLGYEVVVARNGKEALEKFAQQQFDAVLMDVQMPVMDGYTATRAIRLESAVPIIGMTAHALTGDREKCIEAGMSDYISKPFTPEELKSKLEHYVKMKVA